jgi:hypothetical protein
MPANTVYVGRPTKWGNPYIIGRVTGPFLDGPRIDPETALEWYRNWLMVQLVMGKLNLDELRGKNLACWCPLDQPCHADVLIQFCKNT